MARRLADSEIHTIIAILQSWDTKLSWQLLVEKCEDALGRCPSRQTLARAPRVMTAFREAKKRLRDGDHEGANKPRSSSAQFLEQRIKRLEIDNAQLKRENRQLLEQFVVWQYNATAAGITRGRLNQALPPIDLRSTAKPKSK